jgi:iron complex outermembrane receptor protein
MMKSISVLALGAGLLAFPLVAHADEADAPSDSRTIVVNGQKQSDTIENAPSTKAGVSAEQIAAKVNAVSVEDTLKYLPSLVIRKRHIGDNFAPIATRTSGLGASARSLIYADGALLSALIGNNNGNGSPRWSLVTPEEIERIDVLYGPFSAAYSGNSIGTTVNITTRLPEKLEARATALVNVQDFSLYGTKDTLPTTQFSGSIGDRFGPLALFASYTRTEAHSQPISFTTITGTNDPAGTSGGYADLNKLAQAIRVLGGGGIEHHVQSTYKVKAALDLSSNIRATYVLGIWTDKTEGSVDSYLADATGAVSYKTAASGVTTGFNSAVYTRDALHFSHALSLSGSAPQLDWQIVGTLYDYAHDWQNNPSPDASSATTAATGFIGTRNDLPAAFAGGVGTIQKQDGTGWVTLDGKAAIRLGRGDAHTLSFGAHLDRETLNAQTLTLANWLDSNSAQGQLRSASHGNTRTFALWAQDAVKLTPSLTLTLGARQEWWRAYGGFNTTLSTAVNATIQQPERRFNGFSPKASLEWKGDNGYSVRLSAGQAYRTPTVGELYQTTAVGTQLANPNPSLLPERARSLELALTKQDAHGTLRISLFNEVIDNALISQLNAATNTTFVQNVDRTRARGVELALDRRDILPRLDLSASLTYADAITSKDTVFPAAVGKLLPSVPYWKCNMVLTWRATPRLSLTTAARFTSRNFANLANDDTVGQTYQGFYKYFVVDMRATFRLNDHLDLAVGVDNLNNDKYFLFHPFPQRNFTAQVNWKL